MRLESLETDSGNAPHPAVLELKKSLSHLEDLNKSRKSLASLKSSRQLAHLMDVDMLNNRISGVEEELRLLQSMVMREEEEEQQRPTSAPPTDLPRPVPLGIEEEDATTAKLSADGKSQSALSTPDLFGAEWQKKILENELRQAKLQEGFGVHDSRLKNLDRQVKNVGLEINNQMKHTRDKLAGVEVELRNMFEALDTELQTLASRKTGGPALVS